MSFLQVLDRHLNQSQTGLKDLIKWVDWGLPVSVPLVQYRFGGQKAYTRELLIRDLFTFAAGAFVFIVSLPIFERGLRTWLPTLCRSDRMVQFWASLGGVAINIPFCGMATPRIAQWLEKKLTLTGQTTAALPLL